MSSLNITNVPDSLVKRLELAASARKRDLAGEVIERLDDSFGPRRVAARRSGVQLLELARHVRDTSANHPWLTPEFLRFAREYGRR